MGWLPPSTYWLYITDRVALFKEIGWLCHPVIFINFINLVNMVIWNRSTIFYPFTISLIGGYLINREYVDDTKKNILLVPVSWNEIVKAKVIVIFLLNLIFALFQSVLVTITGALLQCGGINLSSIAVGCKDMIIVQICIIIGILPIILASSWSKGKYVWGSLLSMMLGVIGIFTSNGKIVNMHPITTGFSLISYEMVNGAELNASISILALIAYIFGGIIVFCLLYKKDS